jgi:hypothetical protein
MYGILMKGGPDCKEKNTIKSIKKKGATRCGREHGEE